MSPAIYLVLRDGADETATSGEPQIAFSDADLADQHAQTATRETGRVHRVRPVTLAQEAPTRRTWHAMTVEVELSGAEMWRHEEHLVSFSGHPDAVPGSSSTWRVIVRDAPSQPPSRVRIEVTGPDRAWCITEARSCWAQAHASAELAEAAAIEEMLAASRTS